MSLSRNIKNKPTGFENTEVIRKYDNLAITPKEVKKPNYLICFIIAFVIFFVMLILVLCFAR